ncbi:uncharacterized protein BDCG_16708 [Blastomyces dermatitidis ER-3]|uniref:Uncharacterized protein n=1 Tax=Ajellomyces dermatitidis (strain ER-3 / ATCC MYA-2586) TaxID=559297 RepID=A0ABX2VV65_AJEDR|nr:uncharacterized protein BDCG_16708 [Blastomyces dermatitidis ER-3]OAT00633.1 hypothetical protein BDCG_16708 [Blastomyces dermatitidis ER-3]
MRISSMNHPTQKEERRRRLKIKSENVGKPAPLTTRVLYWTKLYQIIYPTMSTQRNSSMPTLLRTIMPRYSQTTPIPSCAEKPIPFPFHSSQPQLHPWLHR